MRVDDFDYILPDERIAQHPIEPRDAAQLLLAENGNFSDYRCRDLTEILQPGDCIVVNTTKVFPARVYGRKDTGGHIECLLLHPVVHSDDKTKDATRNDWQCLIKGKVSKGTIIELGSADFITTVTVQEVFDDGSRSIRFPAHYDVWELCDHVGSLPLPPYIKRADTDEDRDRYQTVYAGNVGSVAAPTAGLHFTEELLEKLEQLGVTRVGIELHVGPGTFKPVQVDDVTEHDMHSEWYHASAETVEHLKNVRARGNRVIAIGTTVCRTLHAIWDDDNNVWNAGAGWTNIFLYPPKRLPAIDGLLTNFHLPRSTLLMLVACATGVERLQAIYDYALTGDYRFYSYGDAMLLLDQPGFSVS